jgi:hypothetical protein
MVFLWVQQSNVYGHQESSHAGPSLRFLACTTCTIITSALKGGPYYIHGCSPNWCSDAILGHQALALSSAALSGDAGVALLAPSSIAPGL